jgi:hypothetical protein
MPGDPPGRPAGPPSYQQDDRQAARHDNLRETSEGAVISGVVVDGCAWGSRATRLVARGPSPRWFDAACVALPRALAW